ncbi:MAG TPA: hypothetical protein VKU37_02785 [Verrucomicrobiae bacterium]|nr:hypothetical protein [Verrucomicrobiae bacterium]
MKPLQITLFIIANVIFITQGGRDVHELIWGTETSILDQFSPEKVKAQSEKKTEVLVDEFRNANDQILALEKGKGWQEMQNISQEHQDLYQKRDALRSEISERESKAREFRDVWIFTAYGVALIILGTVLYRSRAMWPGLSIVISGFAIFEYWVSPSFFSGASAEFHALLVSKTVLTVTALVALYVVWRIMRPDTRITHDETKAS